MRNLRLHIRFGSPTAAPIRDRVASTQPNGDGCSGLGPGPDRILDRDKRRGRIAPVAGAARRHLMAICPASSVARVADSFDIVAVRVTDESAVVARVVLRP